MISMFSGCGKKEKTTADGVKEHSVIVVASVAAYDPGMHICGGSI